MAIILPELPYAYDALDLISNEETCICTMINTIKHVWNSVVLALENIIGEDLESIGWCWSPFWHS